MVRGIDSGFEYRLKAVYSPLPHDSQGRRQRHDNNQSIWGEGSRSANLPWSPGEVQVRVENKVDVIVSGADREKVGQTAANIERA